VKRHRSHASGTIRLSPARADCIAVVIPGELGHAVGEGDNCPPAKLAGDPIG
jgi:hypothetical protein